MSKQDQIYIYQANDLLTNRERRFISYDHLTKLGLKPEYERYDMVFRDTVISGLFTKNRLNEVYSLYNGDMRPNEFKGRSLSVSDVLVIEKPDEVEAYYVDRIGFVELPEFAKEHMLRYSPLRNKTIYELQAADVFDIILSLEVVDDLSQDEIKDIVDSAKYKLSLDYDVAVQALIENYIAERDYNERRKMQNDR